MTEEKRLNNLITDQIRTNLIKMSPIDEGYKQKILEESHTEVQAIKDANIYSENIYNPWNLPDIKTSLNDNDDSDFVEIDYMN
jgi:hypothetical protein